MKLITDLAISETGFVFDPSTGHTYRLNRIGTHIVKMLQSSGRIDTIAEKIAEKFDIDEEIALEDIKEFITLLKSEGFKIDES